MVIFIRVSTTTLFFRDNRYYEKIGKNEPVDITDDLPFDVPNNWSWSRMGIIFVQIGTGVERYVGSKKYYSTGSIKGDEYIPEGEYSFDERPSRANRIGVLGDLIDAKMQSTIKVKVVDKILSGSLLSTGFYVYRNILMNTYFFKYL